MTNYNNGKIYKIVCNKTGVMYIGSTTKRLLSERLSQHKSAHKSFVEGKRQWKTSSFDIINNGDYHIELIELFPCSCKDELIAREKYYILNIPNINKQIPTRTKQEYLQDNIERLTQYKKEWNKAHPLTKDKFTCECGVISNVAAKTRHFKSARHCSFIANKTA
jgi:hypothetical protein